MHTEYTFTQKTYYELQKGRLLFYSLLAVLGVIGIIVFIILFNSYDFEIAKYFIFFFIPSLVFAGFGLLYTVMILVMIFKLRDTEVSFTYDFNKESARIKSYNNGEVTSDTELFYNYIYRYKQTKTTFFFYLPSKKVFPLDANDPKLEDIKKLVKIEDIPRKKI